MLGMLFTADYWKYIFFDSSEILLLFESSSVSEKSQGRKQWKK